MGEAVRVRYKRGRRPEIRGTLRAACGWALGPPDARGSRELAAVRPATPENSLLGLPVVWVGYRADGYPWARALEARVTTGGEEVRRGQLFVCALASVEVEREV